jgi:hypothetical protein
MDANLTIALCAVLVAYFGVAKPAEATAAAADETAVPPTQVG